MKLYFEFLSIHLKKAMQYKASFLLSALAQLFIPLTCFWGVQFMFMRFKQVDGFTYTEVSLCYAIVLLHSRSRSCSSVGLIRLTA